MNTRKICVGTAVAALLTLGGPLFGLGHPGWGRG
jgi:hypothetical protein